MTKPISVERKAALFDDPEQYLIRDGLMYVLVASRPLVDDDGDEAFIATYLPARRQLALFELLNASKKDEPLNHVVPRFTRYIDFDENRAGALPTDAQLIYEFNDGSRLYGLRDRYIIGYKSIDDMTYHHAIISDLAEGIANIDAAVDAAIEDDGQQSSAEKAAKGFNLVLRSEARRLRVVHGIA